MKKVITLNTGYHHVGTLHNAEGCEKSLLGFPVAPKDKIIGTTAGRQVHDENKLG